MSKLDGRQRCCRLNSWQRLQPWFYTNCYRQIVFVADGCLLACFAVEPGRNFPMFQRCLRKNPEESYLHTRRRENLKCHCYYSSFNTAADRWQHNKCLTSYATYHSVCWYYQCYIDVLSMVMRVWRGSVLGDVCNAKFV